MERPESRLAENIKVQLPKGGKLPFPPCPMIQPAEKNSLFQRVPQVFLKEAECFLKSGEEGDIENKVLLFLMKSGIIPHPTDNLSGGGRGHFDG